MGFFSRKNKSSVSAANLGLRIVLEHSATPLYELRTGEYSREIVIGRGSDCTWSLNGVDGSASTRHAMISRRKDNFYITDLGSRNGIFFQNKRIKERKLESGDKITLGECVITVENVTESIKKVSQFNRLVYVSEKGRRVTIDITKPQMIIGSAPDCDIIFQDQLVSSQHAEINQRSDGSCWLKDLGSRNGTSVNGAELLPDGERMLQDNDVITIAYWDINFWDATVQHQNSKIWPAIIAVAITTVVVLTGFVIYSKLTPDAPSLIEIATKEMQAGRYDSAKKILLDSVPYAEGAQEIQVQREQLLWRIEQWEKVIKMWDSVQDDLRNKFFSRAIQKLSTISDGDLNSWTWPGGAQEKQKANAIKRLLDACSMSSSGMKNVLTSVSDIDRIRRELIVAMTEAAKYEDDYFVATVNFSKPFLAKVEKTLSEDKDLHQTLALLEVAKPDYQAIRRQLEKLSEESGGPVKVRADRVLPAVIILQRETQRTLAMVDKVCELDFKMINDFELDLPENIDYSSEKNIGSLRNQLVSTVSRFKDAAVQLSLLHGNLVNLGVKPGNEIPVLEAFTKEDNLKRIYQIDSLDLPLPKNSRNSPAGEYDKFLGIEFFYDYVSNVHNHTTTINPDELPFQPDILKLKRIVNDVEKLIVFADKDENQWFNQRKFAVYLRHCKEILKRRDDIVAAQLKRPDNPASREFLISRGIAAYLHADVPAKEKVEAAVEKSFALQKRNILNLNREYNIAMPEEALQIRTKIINAGMPGDPILKKMWQQRPAAGWSK